ncbi:hypothetical protein NUW58_g3268 [Xylaria curta]|uniref:Uncharacterized protein n=1 Tax=Xylaria curta TaxID=42375 RepID=A0ACC1PBS0_9PEZI|nr:hypothetical protein NUW58_g3268 [Xylaria curta]
MSSNSEPNVSIRNKWARWHSTLPIKERLSKEIPPGGAPKVPPESGSPVPIPPDSIYPDWDDPLPVFKDQPPRGGRADSPQISDVKIAIIGAGAAGLFTGMILDYLNTNLKNENFKISYDIFEAAGKDRVGGRLFTYNFQAKDSAKPHPHHYYDVGAMRFPDNKIMERAFDLFSRLKMEKRKLSENPPAGSLVPYYFQNKNDDGKVIEPWCFNTKTKWGDWTSISKAATDADAFDLNKVGKKIPISILQLGPNETLNGTIHALRDALRRDLEQKPPGSEGFKLLMTYDKYSTRQFLAVSQQHDPSRPETLLPPFNYETIAFLETFNSGTNWFDQAHSETVLDSLDFGYFDPPDSTQWWAIMGGAQELAKRMEATLCHKPQYQSRVTAIGVDETGRNMEIKIGQATKAYNGVFNTTTLGALGRIDTKNAQLAYPVRQAIRSLGYSASAKVGIKFGRAWWIHDLPRENRIKKGGLGHSDLSIRTCVYPSYNILDGPNVEAVLLCSYTWAQDADRIGALMSNSTNHEQRLKDEIALKELLLRDLARLHATPEKSEEEIYKLISRLYVDHHSHSWSHDPNTAGAFAFFRPEQFSKVWSNVIHPTGNLVLLGEACSPHHGWVAGALESVVHGLCVWLKMRSKEIRGAEAAIELLQKYEAGNPFIGLPPYMDQNITDWSACLAAEDMEEAARKLRGC